MQPRWVGDLTDAEWAVLAPLIPPARPGGRPRSVCVREVMNAILYRERTGCSWRSLPEHLPPWGTVFYYYRRWRRDGTWPRLVAALKQLRRLTRAEGGERRSLRRLVPLPPVAPAQEPAARATPGRPTPVPLSLAAPARLGGWPGAGTHLAPAPGNAGTPAARGKAWQPT